MRDVLGVRDALYGTGGTYGIYGTGGTYSTDGAYGTGFDCVQPEGAKVYVTQGA